MSKQARPASGWRAAVGGLAVAAGVLALMEGALQLVGFRPFIERHDFYLALSTRLPLFTETRAADGTLWLETAQNKRRLFNAQRFRKHKDEGVRRVFCMGGSTTYGHPYDDRTSFCGWLRAFLAAAEPGARWEIINAGGISYPSYRVADLMDELSGYAPDLFLVYTGHNEFLERRSYASALLEHPLLGRVVRGAAATRVFSLLPAALEWLGRAGAGVVRPGRAGALPAEVETLLDNSLGPSQYHRDDALRAHTLEHYRFSLTRMTRLAAAAGARIWFVTPASNLADCSPFRSEADAALRPEQAAQFQALLQAALTAEEAGRLDRAEELLRRAVAIDPRHADAQYRLGRVLQARGSSEEAYAFFVKARDEDVCPLRASSQIEQITREVARSEGAVLVDFAAWLRRRAASELGAQAPGSRYFLDHVHPTVEVNRMLALELLGELVQQRLAVLAPGWADAQIRAVTLSVKAGIDEVQQGNALRTLAKLFSWAGKSAESARLARLALEKLGKDAESQFIIGAHALAEARYEDAVQSFREAIELEPEYAQAHTNLAISLAQLGEEEAALGQYQSALRIDPASANALYNRGNLHFHRSEFSAAIADYRQALALSPTDPDARANLVMALLASGDRAGASAEYRGWRRLDPDDALARARLADLAREFPEAVGVR